MNSESTSGPGSSTATLANKQILDPFSPEALFSGGGELGVLMKDIDWSHTALGPVETWPQNLKTCVRIVLTSRQPMFVWWGDELINLYNDAYKTIVGGKHPAALGQPARIVWSEIWDQVAPRAESAMRANEGTYDEALMLIMERYGYREETYYTFSYSPVPNDQGGTGGIFCANSDDTQRIVSERQLAVLGDLAARTADARTWQEACVLSAQSLATDPKDICFALIYVLDEGKKLAALMGASGIELGHPAAPEVIPFSNGSIWPLTPNHTHSDTHISPDARIVDNLRARFTNLPSGAWDQPPHAAAILPILPSGPSGRTGILVVGLNPYRKIDDNYTNFLKLIANQISSSGANAEAYEQERRRAESLAELDRAKTTFFSNVSHEFRTPLTLMLGPLEDMLADPPPGTDFSQLHQTEVVHRNGLRLLKLVNTLLDFSRIEAGRVQALFQPTDLCAVSSELASVFRSAMESAGLKYVVNCEPLSQAVYVDAEMWEKIVLNLLSNALKFTMAGRVEVTLKATATHAEFSVEDTGVGIPEDELPRIFERFHRVAGTRGRTHEGTGIGLALVDELVRQHGGSVTVTSQRGKGTTFLVRIPFGSAHLSPEHVVEEVSGTLSLAGTLPYVHEALQWLPRPDASGSLLPGNSANEDLTDLFENPDSGPSDSARVVLVDDNNDMREYVQRLLARKYQVAAFSTAEDAFAAIGENPADLVLTDVMLPGLDGFGLLRQLRSEPTLATIPVIMLSARAGEESRSEGMEAGADDYLVKPFTARELMARVGSHIAIHRLRSRLTAREREQRLKAEKAEERYRSILGSISEGFLFVDRDWTIAHANEQAAVFTAQASAELIGKNLWSQFPGMEKSSIGHAYRRAMATGEDQRVEEHDPSSDRWLRMHIYSSADGLSIFGLDVTERRSQQKQLLVTEKLAATGRLAATIAHEINNPLESVLNLLYLARISRSASPEQINEYLVTAERELTRVSEIARHTLGFYRETSVPGNVDIERVIEDVLTVYRSRLDANLIQVVRRYNPVPSLHALRGELHQVFSNLVSNAIDAMPGGGRLIFTLRKSLRESQPGVEICVEDNGTGIAAGNLGKLFEPFFTTKASVGTGLGLWVVKQFVEEHGGNVTVESSTSTPAHRTRFIIFLPLSATISPASRVM